MDIEANFISQYSRAFANPEFGILQRLDRYSRNRLRESLVKKPLIRFIKFIPSRSLFLIGYEPHLETVYSVINCLSIKPNEVTEIPPKDNDAIGMILGSENLFNHRTWDGLLIKYNPYNEISQDSINDLLLSFDIEKGYLIPKI